MNEVLDLNDSIETILFKMSQGNPGALTVLCAIMKNTATIDPDEALEGFGPVLQLDTMNIRGSKIWMLFKDVCKQDLNTTLAVLRGWQLGFIDSDKLDAAISNHGSGLNLDDVCAKVKERLPRFQLSHSPVAS